MALLDALDPSRERALIASVSAATEAFLKANADATAQALDIVAAALSTREDGYNWENLDRDLRVFAAPDLAYLLTWLALDESGDRLARLEQEAHPSVVQFCRFILGRHGRGIQAAYQAWEELPTDWRLIWRNVSFNYSVESWILNVRLERYDGETLELEAPPDSIANLCRYLLDMLVTTGQRRILREDTVSDLADSMNELRGNLASVYPEVFVAEEE